MNRKETTQLLSELLVKQKLLGTYWASEVTLDFGLEHPKRVDFMQFTPKNTISVSGIEKGEFTCYEVKSCLGDYKSGYGQNFIGEKNYFVMPMLLYKKLLAESAFDIYTGVIVPIPKGSDKFDEFENPTELDYNKEWELIIIKNTYHKNRNRSLSELLFCMLRSGADCSYFDF